MRAANTSKALKKKGSSIVRYLLIVVLVLLLCLWFVFNFYHINVTLDSYSTDVFGPQSHVEYNSLEAKQDVVMKMDALKHNIALLEKQIVQGNSGEIIGSDAAINANMGIFSMNSATDIPGVSESELQNVIYRRNTRYWLETMHLWPKEPIPPTDKYITFSPWRGGFNNIRMSLEMAVAAAFAFNRTLVMPPVYKMYLRGKSALENYFDYESLRRGIPCITYQEFLERVPEFKAAQQKKQMPDENNPRSQTEYFFEGLAQLKDAAIHDGNFWGHEHRTGGEVVYCDPKCPSRNDNKQGLRGPDKFSKSKTLWFEKFKKGSRRFIDVGDLQINGPKIIHFPQNLLGHFYNFFYFENPQRTRQLKRLIRDHVHYKEEIFELAERIIKKLGDFKFSCLHIRRNEFQFKDVWTPADKIVENIKGLFKSGEQIYIATDELSKGDDHKHFDPMAMTKRNKHTWFTPMLEEYGEENVHFLDEYFDKLLVSDVPSIWVGCVESIVCTRARVFIGTRKSTFSGYIQRLRGYMHDVGQKMILDAQTKYPEEYYDAFIGPSWAMFPHATFGGGHPYWGREYNEAWEGVWDPIS